MDAANLAQKAKGDYITKARLEKPVDDGGIFGWGSGSKRPVDALRPGDQPQYLLFSGHWNSHFQIQSVGGTEKAGPAALLLTDKHAIFVTEDEDFRIRYSDITAANAIHKGDTERKLIVKANSRTYRITIFYGGIGKALTSKELRRAIEFLHQQI